MGQRQAVTKAIATRCRRASNPTRARSWTSCARPRGGTVTMRGRPWRQLCAQSSCRRHGGPGRRCTGRRSLPRCGSAGRSWELPLASGSRRWWLSWSRRCGGSGSSTSTMSSLLCWSRCRPRRWIVGSLPRGPRW